MSALNKRSLRPGERIRVLVVDDSVVIRTLVTRVLGEDPFIEVVGTASNGVVGLQRIEQLSPDLITLDIEMPEMDGLEMLRSVRRQFPRQRVIMFSTMTERGAAITFEALSLGADDYVTKASNTGSLDRSMTTLRAELLPKVRQFFRLPDEQPTAVASKKPAAPFHPDVRHTIQAVVIGVSTGGPAALHEILPALPGDFPLPILVVQHMPPLFTRLLAERLNAACRLPVAEAKAGEAVHGGRIYLAPGDFHMKLSSRASGVFITLDQSPPLNSCRPAVDALFSSACDVYSGSVLAVVLTGMGQDGLRGTEILKSHGALVLAQDESTSVVWGMPGAVVNAKLADHIAPLGRVAADLQRMAGRN